jgi:hypothetical protein
MSWRKQCGPTHSDKTPDVSTRFRDFLTSLTPITSTASPVNVSPPSFKMSLTSALRPVGIPLGLSTTREGAAADGTSTRPFNHEVQYINLDRMLKRYSHLILLTPARENTDAIELSPLQRQIQAELWSPLPYHRTKWLKNVEGARSLLLQLERKAQGIRIQRTKSEAVRDLAEKRATVKRLRNRIEEIGREVDTLSSDGYKPPFVEEGGETIYDFLMKREKSLRKDEHDEDAPLRGGKPVTQLEEAADTVQPGTKEQLFGASNLRRRAGQDQADNSDTAQTSGFSSLPTTEKSLLKSSREHEDISASLLNMATQLKQEQRKLQFSLAQDKSVLGRAMEGLDVSLGSMEAASKNMKFLTRMSEEEGWLGRLKLYAMIFGMWVVAILLVFVCPKLRF